MLDDRVMEDKKDHVVRVSSRKDTSFIDRTIITLLIHRVQERTPQEAQMLFQASLVLYLFAGSALTAALPHELVKRADLSAFDVSSAQAPYNSNFWVCAHNAGYGKAVIRAYQQACGSVGGETDVSTGLLTLAVQGGKVDPNFVPAVAAAKAAGFTKVDGYMFPCRSDWFATRTVGSGLISQVLELNRPVSRASLSRPRSTSS